ncbi:hypothetical protein HBA55_02345 [Pseudomaricurvus alkylphenolicus]|uniref:hypothetical protein n=1 Tax=Pseudomaricurvus alkylphenolicus TaxID=1306991 RepID=UPI00141DC141|nr:hypothetical protein [Pseudomaricurvus alkylphenolicus]NIB38404.1 hypothetical protein [Pseudomaricurvus alkylphenolicus]
MHEKFRIVPYREHPQYVSQALSFEAESFPKYIEEDAVWADISPHFYDEFADFQFFVVDETNHQLVGVCNCVPFNWSGDPDQLPSYHQMLTDALKDWRAGRQANTLSPVQAIINPVYRGQGVSQLIFAEAARLSRAQRMTSVMVAVRPTLKDQYPLVPIEEYARWRRSDGQLFDPWLRAQERIGSEMIKPVAASTVIEGAIADWERWTGMKFPASGEYWLPGGLSTLTIDLENNIGRHCEPHVWYRLSGDDA